MYVMVGGSLPALLHLGEEVSYKQILQTKVHKDCLHNVTLLQWPYHSVEMLYGEASPPLSQAN